MAQSSHLKQINFDASFLWSIALLFAKFFLYILF